MIYVEICCENPGCEHLARRGKPRCLGEVLLAPGTGVRLLCIACHHHTLVAVGADGSVATQAVANPERILA